MSPSFSFTSQRRTALALVLFVPLLIVAQPAAEPKGPPAVVELIEDDTDGLIKRLTNDGGLDSTQIRQEVRDVYSGVSSIRVTPFQRFSANIQGWSYPIVENPRAGEYRFIRFAWKREGGDSIMIQLHSKGSWNQRYYAGNRSPQTATWGAMTQVDAKVPREWTVVTRDLFKDWGPMTLAGIALSTLENGAAGYYDHIYLGRAIEDLDRATAAAFGKPPAKEALSVRELGELWEDLAKSDIKAASMASRKLVAGQTESVPYLDKMLRVKHAAVDVNEVTGWIAALSAEDFQTREEGHRSLSKLGDRAIPHLLQARAKATSSEQKSRLEALLKERGALDGDLTGERLRLIRVARILEWAGTAEALASLEALDKAPEAALLPEIKQARDRLVKTVRH